MDAYQYHWPGINFWRTPWKFKKKGKKKVARRPLFLKYDCHYLSNEPLLVLYVAFMRQKGHCALYFRGQIWIPELSLDTHDSESVSHSTSCATWLVTSKQVFISGFETQKKTSLLCQSLLTTVDVSLVQLALINLHFMTSSHVDHYTGLAINPDLLMLEPVKTYYVFLFLKNS